MQADMLFRRFWLLSILGGLERAGVCPIEFRQLNAVLYLVNTLSSSYHIPPLISTVVKEPNGPLYPDLIWDLDRLVGMCQCSVQDLEFDKEHKERFAKYSITKCGLELLKATTKNSMGFNKTKEAIYSITLAYGRNQHAGDKTNLLRLDANYAAAQYNMRDVIDFGDWDPFNPTKQSVEYITSKIAPRMMGREYPSISVNLYTEYLGQGPRAPRKLPYI